jgi:hypothetical protein
MRLMYSVYQVLTLDFSRINHDCFSLEEGARRAIVHRVKGLFLKIRCVGEEAVLSWFSSVALLIEGV